MADATRPASTRSPMRARSPALGAGEILLTSMDRDGTGAGFDLELTRAIADAVSVPVIASGGVGTLDHLVDGVLDGHATAVLAASIFHFGDAHDRRRQGGIWRPPGFPCGLTAKKALISQCQAPEYHDPLFPKICPEEHRGQA